MKYAQPLLFLLLFSVAGTAFAQAPPPSTWVQHIIIVVQENRTPDSLFGAYPFISSSGMDIQSTAIACQGHGNINLTSQPFPECFDPNHGHTNGFEAAYDQADSTFDNACNVPVDYKSPCAPPTYPSASFASDSNHILDPYYNIAENFGAANYMFATQQGPSFIGHQFLFSGTSAPENYNSDNVYTLFASENAILNGASSRYAGCASAPGTTVNDLNSNYPGGFTHPFFPPEGALYTPIPPIQGVTSGYPCYNHTSLADLLDAVPPHGINWKYYVQSSLELNSIWAAPNALQAICKPDPGGNCSTNGNNMDWNNVQSTMGQILTDIQSCQLPQVSWVIPDGQWSDHPGDVGADGGPSWVSAIVNAVGGVGPNACVPPPPATSPYWGNTVILITWDDWGGFFDHIAPYNNYQGGYPNGNGNGMWYVYGFRVPLLVVSQYTQNYISGAMVNGQPNENPPYVHDFGSILGFVEAAFNLPPYSTNNGANTCGIQYLDDETPGQICKYPYADYFAADGKFECGQPGVNCGEQTPYPLEDFFNLSKPRTFMAITGAKYSPSCFQLANVNNPDCFPNYPSDPDDE